MCLEYVPAGEKHHLSIIIVVTAGQSPNSYPMLFAVPLPAFHGPFGPFDEMCTPLPAS